MKEIYALPETVEQLIDHLDAKYPNRCVRPGMTWDDAMRESGARALVDYLIDLRDNPEAYSP